MFSNSPCLCLVFMSEAARDSTSKGVSISDYVLKQKPPLQQLYNSPPSYKASQALVLKLFVRQSVNSFTKALQNKYGKEKQRLDEVFMFRNEKTKAPATRALIGSI